jgi:hypothetical protein
MRRLRTAIPLVALLSAYFAMAVSAAATKSPTFDELPHITAGYTYWELKDYRLDPDNGNLAQRVIGLPLLSRDLRFPSLDQLAWRVSDMWTISDQFFYESSNDPDEIVRRARMSVALLSTLLGAAVFFWARQLFGAAGGWVSLSIFVFSPTMLANGALATSDMFAAAFFTVAVWALWTVLHRITTLTLSASLLATSGLFLSKMSAPLILPMALGMLAVRLASSRPLVIGRGTTAREIHGRRAQMTVLAGLALAHAAVVFVRRRFRPDLDVVRLSVRGVRRTPERPGHVHRRVVRSAS